MEGENDGSIPMGAEAKPTPEQTPKRHIPLDIVVVLVFTLVNLIVVALSFAAVALSR